MINTLELVRGNEVDRLFFIYLFILSVETYPHTVPDSVL